MTDQKTQDACPASPLNGGLADPFEAVLNAIDAIKRSGNSAETLVIGFVTINGKKAQVQISVDTNPFNWFGG